MTPDASVAGDDADLARVVAAHPGALIAFDPSPASDLARAVGLGTGARSGSETTLDALRVDGARIAVNMAVNMVVVGTPPDRTGRFTRRVDVDVVVDDAALSTSGATGVVIATGQYLRGLDVVPRGHPGDGRLEVYAFRLRPGERRAMRARLPHGTHVPHPRISVRPGHRVDVRAGRPVAVEVDGRASGPVTAISVEIVEGAYRLLV